MNREQRNLKQRERRAAKKAAEAAIASAAQQDLDVTSQVIDAEPVNVDATVPAVKGIEPHNGHFIEPDATADAIARESLVQRLIDVQSGQDKTEHDVILEMIASVRSGHATVKEFCTAYAALAADRMKADTVKARKSNLKGVITYANESQEYLLAITSQENQNLNLQGMYKLRQLMLKGPKDESTDAAEGESVGSDDADKLSPEDAMLHAISLAIDAAAVAGYDDIAEKLREVQYLTRASMIDRQNESMMAV